MRCKIMHESSRRLRIHVHTKYMTLFEADKLEYYIRQLSGVTKVHVSERTADATIFFKKGYRDSIIKAVSEYDGETTEVAVPEHSGRIIKREYEDRLFFHIARRIFTRFVLPVPLRSVRAILCSVPFFVKGLKCIAKGKLEVPVLDMVSIAVSMLQGDFNTASNIMFLLGLGDIIEEWTHKKSVNDLASVMSLGVDRVWTKSESGEEILVSVASVKAGDKVIARAGSQIPLDGEVSGGEAMVNQASITGEPLSVRKGIGSYVYAGTVVEEGEVEICVRKEAGDGRYDRIVRMIEESEKLKSEAETKASNLADRLVPYTFGATLLTWLLTGNAARATSILMVDFCCALKLSMPVAVLSAMREAGDHHISVKGGKFMEAVASAKTIVFDKTGTLTYASPKVYKVVPFDGRDETETLRLAACLEEHFPHSMANAVVREAEARGVIHEERHSKVEYVVAHGIASSIEGKRLVIGSYHFVFEDEKCIVKNEDRALFDSLPAEYSHLYMAENGVLTGVIMIEDPLREDAAKTVEMLHKAGFDKIVMMTGDSDRIAKVVSKKVGVDEYFSEVLPEDKAAFINKEHERGRKVIMIGDGINDSPALSASDAGIAISSGAAIAREIADITIAGEDLGNLLVLRELSEKLMERIHSNYRSILTFNSFLILMGALGVFPATTTAVLHNSSTILIGLRSMTDLIDKER